MGKKCQSFQSQQKIPSDHTKMGCSLENRSIMPALWGSMHPISRLSKLEPSWVKERPLRKYKTLSEDKERP